MGPFTAAVTRDHRLFRCRGAMAAGSHHSVPRHGGAI